MAEEQTPQPAKEAAPKAAGKAPAGEAKPKKEKPPALEDKPFDQFIQDNFLPNLNKALKDNGLGDVELSFKKRPLSVVGTLSSEEYWQVSGQWLRGQRQFNIAFTDQDINSPKIFYYADGGAKPSTIEQFMGDERKVTLDLLLLYTLQRLNGQKWLTRN